MDVSILISVHNCVDLTRQCIDSLFETMPEDLSWEVIVYDDCSTDGTKGYLESQTHRIRVIPDTERGWYARNNNVLAEAAAGRWLVFLNNDTICLPGWFEPLYATAQAEPDVGIVGGLQVYPERKRVNHAGVVITRGRLPCHLYEGLDPDDPAVTCTRQLQAVTGACCMVLGSLFAELGGLHEGYVNGYEDIDLCLRARQAGWSVWYCGGSSIVHYGGCTAGRFDSESANQRLFLKRTRGLAVPDLKAITKADGMAWPLVAPWWSPRGMLLRLFQMTRHSRLVRPLYNRLIQFRVVVAVRGMAHRLLTP
ncbi:MAG: glycosyltransferase family 2 protein [Planctomycetes bacterium]|nr:glycosyltransferase family 2 protein [Planctomycetota bacterium]